jgi:hypothetical protein
VRSSHERALLRGTGRAKLDLPVLLTHHEKP